ncbi:MAG: hypothetical protein CMF74_11180 [Maricaulis sp.]|nr:hypothetical protein [Maricaulis sp.]HAQ34580.1 peptidoglycan editing factor PgeF [Alphaproteobacteria bacterium]
MSELEFLRAETLNRPGIVHAFTTRHGGVSKGGYSSLNLSWKDGDDKDDITENRRRVTEALGLDRLIFLNQVHGNTVHRVEAIPETGWSVGQGDGLITNIPGLGLVTQTADCTPVLLFDPVNRAVGAVHSGWRGTVQDVVGETVEAMVREYGTDPADLLAAIGPAITPANYRVGPEVLDQFEDLFGSLKGLALERDDEGGAGIDVSQAVRRQLAAAGIPETQIERLPVCTYGDERFFSCRRAKGTPFGGQAGIIALV